MLIVGNVTKDVYLRLDERKNKFEVDGGGVAWLDLAFDGSSHNFFARHAVFGGAAISLEVLARMGVGVGLSGSEMGFADGRLTSVGAVETYRYVLCRGDEIVYFSPSQRRAAQWVVPEGEVEWIYVDRSATVSPELAEGILGYLEEAESAKLAFFVGKRANRVHAQKLKEQADLIFAEEEDEVGGLEKCVYIGSDFVQSDEARVGWGLAGRQDMMTHLTTSSIIAASVLGAVALGKPMSEALLLARANVENANLDGTMDLKRLEEVIVGEEYRIENSSRSGEH